VSVERIELQRGDITALEVDAVVTAANSRLAGGGGVDGAVHRAAGSELLAACQEIGACPTGEARITSGFALPARYVIHAVGPVWHGGHRGEPAQLASAYRHSLELAAQHDCRSLAFPAISCGVYGYPIEQAATLSVASIADFLADDRQLERVVLCAFDADIEAAWARALRETA